MDKTTKRAIEVAGAALGVGLVGFAAYAAVKSEPGAGLFLALGGIALGIEGCALAANEHPAWSALALGGFGLAAAPVASELFSEKPKYDLHNLSGKNDLPIDGGWRIRDVSDRTKLSLDVRQSLKAGQKVVIVLNGDRQLRDWFDTNFIVEIIGGRGGDLQYPAIWTLIPPWHAPQTLAFGPEHVLALA